MIDSTLIIGNRLEVTPLSQVKSDLWVSESSSLFKGWSCFLIHRASTPVFAGQPLIGWIFDLDPLRCRLEVSDSNFGFLPISDRMRPRYIISLNRLIALLHNYHNPIESDAEFISEVKGMFSRCARRDQWDWRAVHLSLGEPTRVESRKIATILGDISASLRRGDMKSACSGLANAGIVTDLLHRLLNATTIIKDSGPTIPKSRTPRTRSPHQSEITPQARSIVSTYAKQKLDTANATHATLLDILDQFLGFHGYRVEANQFIDAFTRLKSGPALFEAKSVTDDNELSQIRHGLSQLYEYRYRHGFNDATLWLVLSRVPKEDWIINYLEKDREIHVLWLEEEGQLSGPCIERLLESGSEALRRHRETQS